MEPEFDELDEFGSQEEIQHFQSTYFELVFPYVEQTLCAHLTHMKTTLCTVCIDP